MAITSPLERRRLYNQSLNQRDAKLNSDNYGGNPSLGVTPPNPSIVDPNGVPAISGGDIVTGAGNVVPRDSFIPKPSIPTQPFLPPEDLQSNVQQNANYIANASIANQSPIQTVAQLASNTGVNGGQNQYTKDGFKLPDYKAASISNIPQNNALNSPLQTLQSNASGILANRNTALNTPGAQVDLSNYNNLSNGFLDSASAGMQSSGADQIARYDDLLAKANREYRTAENTFALGGDLLDVINAKRTMRNKNAEINNLENARGALNSRMYDSYASLRNNTANSQLANTYDAAKVNAGFNQQVGLNAMNSLNSDLTAQQTFQSQQMLNRQAQALKDSSPSEQLANLGRLNALQQDERLQLANQEAFRNPTQENIKNAALLGGSAGSIYTTDVNNAENLKRTNLTNAATLYNANVKEQARIAAENAKEQKAQIAKLSNVEAASAKNNMVVNGVTYNPKEINEENNLLNASNLKLAGELSSAKTVEAKNEVQKKITANNEKLASNNKLSRDASIQAYAEKGITPQILNARINQINEYLRGNLDAYTRETLTASKTQLEAILKSIG